MPAGLGRVRVRFDERALDEDVARLSSRGQIALRQARDEFERDGLPSDRLRACQAEHGSGTDLPGCVKTYIPDWDGEWRMIFQIAADQTGLLLSYLAGGVGHQPRGARAPDAYQLAHHRLHGRWPRRSR
jgi:hypothetical protein